MIRILFGFLLILGVSGCATTQNKTTGDQMQSRMVELEKKLEEKDAEIVDLQYEVKDLSSKIETNNPAPVSAEPAVNTPTPIAPSKSGDDIIRVGTNALNIQTALKNAGVYTGRVDGKIGPATKAAIIEFQKSHGLIADGVVGRKTWETLKQYLKQ